MNKIPSGLAQWLYTSQPGAICEPVASGEWITIARLERIIPIQLDDKMRRMLINELFDTWLQEQLMNLASDGSISLN